MTTVEGGHRLLGGRYELQERIATGGMGEVWRGRDVVLQRTVAVKVLRSEYADDPTFVERFRAEARNAAALNHPNIACVLDYGEASTEEAGEHLAYLVMELVEGAPLSARLASEGPMAPADALSVLQQTAAGLAEAHRRGLVHRDVKPANILVRPDGRVKLTDFGIARSADSVPLTGTGQVVGTAQYMSPEQAKGEPATPASDVYSLGLVGYESLTGHAAFEGTNPVTVALQHVVADPQPLPADLPDEVRGLIDSALAKDPHDRIPDGAAFLSAVRETLGEEPDGAPVLRTRASDTAPVRAVVAAGASRAPASASRRRALAVLVPLVLLIVAAGSFALALGGYPGTGGDAAEQPSAAADRGIVLTDDDYLGRPFDDVAAELTAMGLDVARVEQVTSDHPAGTVTAVEPEGTRLDDGDEVRVTVAVAPAEQALRDAPETTGGSVGGASAPVDEDAAGGPAPTGDPATTGSAPAPGSPSGAPDEGSTPADAPESTTPSGQPGTDPGTPTSPAPDAGAPTSPAPDAGTPADPAPVDPAPSDPGPSDPDPADPSGGGTTGGGTTGGGTTEPPATGPAATDPGADAAAPAAG